MALATLTWQSTGLLLGFESQLSLLLIVGRGGIYRTSLSLRLLILKGDNNCTYFTGCCD